MPSQELERAQKAVLLWKQNFLMTKERVCRQVLCRQKDPVPAPAVWDAFKGGVAVEDREAHRQRLWLPIGLCRLGPTTGSPICLLSVGVIRGKRSLKPTGRKK